jgi:hypothetical protein
MSSPAFRVPSAPTRATSVRFDGPELGPVSPLRVVLVAGAGRSGSTLLTLLLGSLPETFAVGELRYLWQRCVVERRLCGCGRPLPECALWQSILLRTF